MSQVARLAPHHHGGKWWKHKKAHERYQPGDVFPADANACPDIHGGLTPPGASEHNGRLGNIFVTVRLRYRRYLGSHTGSISLSLIYVKVPCCQHRGFVKPLRRG